MAYSARIGVLIVIALGGASGCATCPAKVQAALARPKPERAVEVGQDYTIGCPDRLNVRIANLQSFDATVEPDGCVVIPGIGRLRVDGVTPGVVAAEIAHHRELATPAVQVTVTEHASKTILMFGPGAGVQRVVPYVGPENLTDMLRRTGGLAPGSAFRAVHVVRPHVASGQRPEVFTVDLAAALDKTDSNDVRLQPSDHIYIGETSGSSLARCMPPWVRAMLPGMKAIDAPAE